MAKSRGYLRHHRKLREANRANRKKLSLAHVAIVVKDHGGAPRGSVRAVVLHRHASEPKRKNKERHHKQRNGASHQAPGSYSAGETHVGVDGIQMDPGDNVNLDSEEGSSMSDDLHQSSANVSKDETMVPQEGATQTVVHKTADDEGTPAEKVLGIYEFCENIMRNPSAEDMSNIRGLNRDVYATILDSKTLRTTSFLEPMPKNQQEFWLHCDKSIYPIEAERIPDHATLYHDNDEQLLLPRQLHPHVAGDHRHACDSGHLKCQFGSLLKSCPQANGNLSLCLQVLSMQSPAALPQLSEEGDRIGFVSVAFPRFVAGESSFLDDSLLTQPPSISVVIAYSVTSDSGSIVHREFMVANFDGVTIGNVRRAAGQCEHGEAALRGDKAGLMVLDEEGRVVLPTWDQTSAMKRYGSLYCMERVHQWNFT
ncbi:hypothetical protein CLAFUR0_03938 [Fulvia fulva]|nr:hypothetical protein CLAFUR0_03938 [Fulvia fulva]